MRKIMLVNRCKYALLVEPYPCNFMEAIGPAPIPLHWRIPSVTEMRAIYRANPGDLERFASSVALDGETAFFTRTLRCSGTEAEVMTFSIKGNEWWVGMFDREHCARLLIRDSAALFGQYEIL